MNQKTDEHIINKVFVFFITFLFISGLFFTVIPIITSKDNFSISYQKNLDGITFYNHSSDINNELGKNIPVYQLTYPGSQERTNLTSTPKKLQNSDFSSGTIPPQRSLILPENTTKENKISFLGSLDDPIWVNVTKEIYPHTIHPGEPTTIAITPLYTLTYFSIFISPPYFRND